MGDIEASEGVGRVFGVVGVVWRPLVGWRHPMVPWCAPVQPMSSGDAQVASDLLPAFGEVELFLLVLQGWADQAAA